MRSIGHGVSSPERQDDIDYFYAVLLDYYFFGFSDILLRGFSPLLTRELLFLACFRMTLSAQKQEKKENHDHRRLFIFSLSEQVGIGLKETLRRGLSGRVGIGGYGEVAL